MLATATLRELAACCGGEVRTGPFGSQLHKADYVDDPLATPVVMPKDMIAGKVDVTSIARIDDETRDRLSQHALAAGDIVLARRGDIGRRAWVGQDEEGWLCGTGSMRVSIRDCGQIRSRYLYYYLATDWAVGWLEGHAVGATMSNLSAGVVEELPVRFPSLTNQDRIIEVLDVFDDLIENNRRRIEILEEMARLIYREWFVHFRFPGHEDVELVDSDLGPIPAGWDVVPFSILADFLNGFAFKPSEHWMDDGLPIIKIRELKNGVTADTPRNPGTDVPRKYFIDDGDILFSWSADLDVYVWSQGPALLNQHLFLVRPKRLTDLFLFHSLRARMPEFRIRSQGTTMRHIKRSALTEVSTTVPPEPLWKQFETFAGPMMKLVLNLTRQNRVLTAARDLLLPRLISGELDVSELEVDEHPVCDEAEKVG